MLKAYIILAHKDFAQLNRLIKQLDDDSSHFFIHIDKKVPKDILNELIQLPGKVRLIKRFNTKWASLSLVEATLTAMADIRHSGIPFNTVFLLSGQDYPIKSNDEIDTFIRTSKYSIMLEHSKLPNYQKWRDAGGMYRVNKYFMGLKFHERYTSKALNFLAMFLPFLRRKLPVGMRPFVGSQWWSMDMYTLNYILDFVKKNPGFMAFNRFTFAPDESFFHTIILNAKDQRIKGNISNDNKRFMIWKTFEKSHPELLRKEHFQELMESDGLFARKFDMDKYPEILDQLDVRLQQESQLNSSGRFSKSA